MMTSYTCLILPQADGTWRATFPALGGLAPLVAASKRRAKRLALRALVSWLQQGARRGEPPPRDRTATYHIRLDTRHLEQYPSLEQEPESHDLR